jgi:mRNA interferase MazF
MIDQVRAIDSKRLVRKVGELADPLKNKVVNNLKIVMDL